MSKPYKLPSDRWLIRWVDHAGKRRNASFDTEREAKSALAKNEHEAAHTRDRINAGFLAPEALRTLAEVAADWIKDRSGRRKRDNAMHLDRHILPFMGDVKISAVDAKVAEKFIRHLEAKTTARKGEKNATGRTLAPATVKNVLITLGKLLSDSGYPLRVKYKVPESGYRWIKEPAQVARFLECCGEGWYPVAAQLAVYAGLRKGEVAGLRRDALDFDRALIRVDRSYEGPTKSKHVRWVPMAPGLDSALLTWVLAHVGALVVTWGAGKHITEKTETAKRTRRACKRAGVPAVTFHQLRHTAASHLAERVLPATLRAVMGHADQKTTDRYVHLDREGIARSVRLHLDFTAPAGEVVTLPANPAVNVVSTAAGEARRAANS